MLRYSLGIYITYGMNDDSNHELYFGLTLYTNYIAARHGM